MARTPRKTLPLIFILAALGACGQTSGGGGYLPYSDGGGTDGGAPARVEATIGVEGGVLVAGAGPLSGLALTFPAGALSAPTLVACEQIAGVDKPLYAGTGPAVRCTPLDVTLAKPVALALPYDDTLLPASAGPASLSILQRAQDGQVYVIDDVTADLNAKTIRTSTYTLGDFQTARVAPTTTKG